MLLILAVAVAMCGCIESQSVDTTGERANMLDSQKTPTLQHSNEREIFMGYLEQTADPNNVQWIYCLDYSGHVVFRSPVKGKVISATKSSEPYERMTIAECGFDGGRSDVDWYASQNFAGRVSGTKQLMNPSGMFGSDTPGCLWMTPDGQYMEYHGGPYFVSDRPLKFQNPILSYENIDYDEAKKYGVNVTA